MWLPPCSSPKMLLWLVVSYFHQTTPFCLSGQIWSRINFKTWLGFMLKIKRIFPQDYPEHEHTCGNHLDGKKYGSWTAERNYTSSFTLFYFKKFYILLYIFTAARCVSCTHSTCFNQMRLEKGSLLNIHYLDFGEEFLHDTVTRYILLKTFQSFGSFSTLMKL